MFRSMRFCYSLTNSYGKLSSVSLRNVLNLTRINSVSCAMYSVPGKTSAISFCDNEDLPVHGSNLLFHFSETSKYLSKILTSDRNDLNWDEILSDHNLPKEHGINPYALIFLICQKGRLYKCAMSIFDYLWKKNEVTAGLLHLFCMLMLESPEDFKCYEKLIFQIFLNVLPSDKASANICSQVLLKSSSKYSDTVYGLYKNHMINDKYHTGVVLSLIAANKINEAIELYVNGEVKLFWLEKLFLKFFLKETLAGKQTIPAICKFLSDVHKIKSDLTITDDNVEILEKLFKNLRTLDANYVWMVNKGKIHGNVCAFCKGKLLTADVTEKEIEHLLKDLEESVIIQDTIFLKSNNEEWNKFCSFVENENYNLVMDGLNMKYALNDFGKFKNMVEEITSHNLTPFILARAHFKTSPECRLLKNKFPLFLTENLSDDDVFILYAALKKGKGCYTLSNDKMKFCNSLLSSPETLDIYKRWQATHQCKLNFRKSVSFPFAVLNGLQKCEDCVEDEFKYHYIATQHLGPPTLICISRIKKEKQFQY